MNVPAELVRKQIISIFSAWGMEEHAVAIAAEAMVVTDLSGVDSHGVSMLMDYEQSRLKGKLNMKAEPKIIRQTAVTALIDADAGMGHPAAVMGMELAIEKAKAMGVAVVSVFNSHHFGAAGYYAALAPKKGLIGMVATATRSINTVPTFGKIPVMGTNPLAFGAPAKRNRYFLLDMATSTAAANKVRVFELNGKPIPSGWVLDGKGQPVTDGAAAVDIIWRSGSRGGGLTPLGGLPEMASYKGYGLAMMVHILGGTLSGASFSPIRVKTQRPEDPDDLGHFFLAIDPKAFRPEGEFEDDLDDVIDYLHATPPIDPANPVLVAGDPEAMKQEERLRDGIPISPALGEKIRGVAERSGVAYLFENA
jgi:LDH2 family malate/lactate/ureidoglycolate dehydrogenase